MKAAGGTGRGDSRPERRSVRHALNPAIVPDLRAVDDIAGDLIQFLEGRGVEVIVLSEYGLTDVHRQCISTGFFASAAGWR